MKKFIAVLFIVMLTGCVDETNSASPHTKAASGVQQTTTHVPVGLSGLTVEQENIKHRLEIDNRPGSIKHLYLLSPFNGRQIFYSTVRGKVTSSGKRLTPTSVASGKYHNASLGPDAYGVDTNIGGKWYTTSEVLQDDGTYGHSAEYLYFWNENGQYYQLYVGGLAVVVSDNPVSFQDVVIRQEKPE